MVDGGFSLFSSLNHRTDDNLSISEYRKGDVIAIIEKHLLEWWKGELDGKVGFFPSVGWVEEIEGFPLS